VLELEENNNKEREGKAQTIQNNLVAKNKNWFLGTGHNLWLPIPTAIESICT